MFRGLQIMPSRAAASLRPLVY